MKNSSNRSTATKQCKELILRQLGSSRQLKGKLFTIHIWSCSGKETFAPEKCQSCQSLVSEHPVPEIKKE